MSTPSEVTARLSCTDSSFPRLSHDAALSVIRDLGLAAVDICVFAEGAHTTPAAVRADPAGVADAIAARVDTAGLAVADVFLILGDQEFAANHPDPKVRDEALAYFAATVELARRLGAPGVSVLPGFPFEGVDPNASLGVAAEQLRRRAELARDAGLALSIEPHVGSIVESPERTLELLDVAPEVTLALDYGHFVYRGVAQEDVDPLIPHARHVHLRQAAEGAMQLPAREGAIDFRRLWRQLELACYEGYVTIEYQWEKWLDCNRVDCVSETAELRDVLIA